MRRPDAKLKITFCQFFPEGMQIDRRELKTKGEIKMSEFTDIINGDKPVIIDFSAEWCQPCRMMPPILKDVKKQLGDRVRILKIDVDKNPAIAQQYQIRNVPTLLVFKNGQVVFRQAGVIPAQQIIQLLQPHI